LLLRYDRLARFLSGARLVCARVRRFGGRRIEGHTGLPPTPRQGRVFAVIFGAVLIVASGRLPVWQPTGSGRAGHRMMRWARERLPEDAVVIIPPYMEESVCAFRYFARRRAVGAWKDGGEGTFDQTFQLTWERQVRDITGVGDRIRVPRGLVRWPRYLDWLAEARQSYDQAPAEHFIDVANEDRGHPRGSRSRDPRPLAAGRLPR